jgi:formylglycine-generating enzyme required for sulfatase activity
VKRLARWMLGVFLAGAGARCVTEETHLLVHITSDMTAGTELQTVDVSAVWEGGSALAPTRHLDLATQSLRLPGEVLVTPRDASDARRVVITVTGRVRPASGAAYTLSQEFVTRFQRGRTLTIVYTLARACRQESCPAGLNCIPGAMGGALCVARESPLVQPYGTSLDASTWNDALRPPDQTAADVAEVMDARPTDVPTGDVAAPLDAEIVVDARGDAAVAEDATVDVARDALADGAATAFDAAEVADRADVDVTDAADADVASDRPSPSDGFIVPDGATQRSCLPRVLGCGLFAVTGGTFTMGDTNAYDSVAAANVAAPLQRDITVSSFLIDQYEVTVERFRAYWSSTGRTPVIPDGGVLYPGGVIVWDGPIQEPCQTVATTCDRGATQPNRCNWSRTPGGREGDPINCVDWDTAMAFCLWDGGRLPTEAEWEFAARGTDTVGHPYPWGPTPDPPDDIRLCWSGARGAAGPRIGTCDEVSAISETFRSPFGASHMDGNVREWVADSFMTYDDPRCWARTTARRNPLCPSGGGVGRTTRGGSWDSTRAAEVRAGARDRESQVGRYTTLGFRCVR